MSAELKTKIDELGRTIEQFKQANDEKINELKKGFNDPVLTSKVDKSNEAITKLQTEIEEVKTAMNRVQSVAETKEREEGKDAKEVKSAFLKALRKGEGALSPDEAKALSVDSNPDGGFLVRPELSSMIVKKMFETSPIRPLAAVQTIGSDSLDILADYDEASASWVAERGTRSATNTPQLKMAKIFAQELYAEPSVTQKLLDDAYFDVEGWLMGKLADKLGRVENAAFVNGTGVGQPRGFTTYGAGSSYGQIPQVGSGSSGAVTADGLISLLYTLKEPYQQNAVFAMQRATMAAVRKLKDSNGRYLFEYGTIQDGGFGEQVLGKKVAYFADMAAIGSGALAIAYADFSKAYQIVDRVGIRILRDPFSSKPNVLFYTTKRTGGDVVNFEAIALQVLS